jgi:dTDP-glucose 4,6-dehydratase
MNNIILVTGGSGFIGSNCIRLWLNGSPLGGMINLDALTYAGNNDSLGDVQYDPRYRFVHGDIRDTRLVRRLLMDCRPRAVLHLAAETHVDRSIDGPGAFVATNVKGTVALLESVHHYWKSLPETEQSNFRFLHVSTDEVYGDRDGLQPAQESSAYAPSSPYAASKAASDHFALAFHRTYGLPVIVTHGTNTYGPYQFPEKLIPLVILNAMEGKPIPVYGHGMQQRDWLHVSDHADALRCVLSSGVPGATYNIGSGFARTNLEVVWAVCRYVDRLCPHMQHIPCRSLIAQVADRPGHDRQYAINAAEMQYSLCWKPLVPFATGLHETVTWYLNNPLWVASATKQYQRQRLGRGLQEKSP